MTLQQIKSNKNALVQALTDAGAKIVGDSFCCPFHSDTKASAGLFFGDARTWRFKCLGCGAKGDVVDITQRVHNEDFTSACKRLGIDSNQGSPSAGNNGRASFGPQSKVARDWEAEQRRYCDALTPDRLAELASTLGVASETIKRIRVGWCDSMQCWTMPECDASKTVIGINRRYANGDKKFFQGGKRGVTIPTDSTNLPNPVVAVEGASDVMSCLTMGVTTIGRPNATGGAEILAVMLKDREVIVLGENDQKPDGSWPGRDGAKGVAQKLASRWNKPVRWALPPNDSKDVRTWLQSQGLSLDDADALREAGRQFIAAVSESAETIEPESRQSPEKETQATILTQIALRECALFHDAEADCFASVVVTGHRETYPLTSRAFKFWLSRRMFETLQKSPGNQAMQDALNTLRGFASYKGEEIETHVRIASHKNKVYLDLCDKRWRAVEIDETGWRIVDTPPVRFLRPRALSELCEPKTGGSVHMLREFVNIKSDDEYILLLAYIVQSLQPDGPFPIAVINGQQGSGKSTVCAMIRKLIDPSTAPLRAAPRDHHDLLIAANNGHVMAFDNLSTIPYWLSDSLCRLSTGGGMTCRRLYTDSEESIFFACRPILINGIESLTERSDLIDRVVRITLPTIPKYLRKQPSKLWADFEKVRPKILGALLDAVSCSIKNFDSVNLPELPRMADFACRTVAAAPALGFTPVEFLSAYDSNRADDNQIALDACIFAPVLRSWIEEKGYWSGTATELLDTLTERAEKAASRNRWPTTAQNLSGQIKRIIPNLSAVGIDVEFGRTTGSRQITIEKCPNGAHRRSNDAQMTMPASQGSPPSAIKNADSDGFGRYDANDDEIQTLSKKDHAGVPSGWTRESWIAHIGTMADRCKDSNPGESAKLKEWAKALRSEGST